MHKPNSPLASTPEMIKVFEDAHQAAWSAFEADIQRRGDDILAYGRLRDGTIIDYKTARQAAKGHFFSYAYGLRRAYEDERLRSMILGKRSRGKSTWTEFAALELERRTGRSVKLLRAEDRPIYRVTSPIHYDPEQLAWMGRYGDPSTTMAYVYKTLQTILRDPERPSYRFCGVPPYVVNDRIRQLFDGLRADMPPINYDACVKRYTHNPDGLYPHQRDFVAAIRDKALRIERGMGKA